MSYPRIYNAAVDMVDRNLTEGRGAKVVFIDPNERLSYAELAGRCNRMANLLTTYAVAREARVALLLLDTVDFPVAFWGAIKAGVIPVALNTLLTSEQYAYILSDSRAQALIVSAPLLAVVRPILGQLPFLKHIFVSGGEAPPYALGFRAELEQQAASFQAAATCCDETAFWLELLVEAAIVAPAAAKSLWKEADELTRIFVSSRETARRRRRLKRKGGQSTKPERARAHE